jgi:hypothetical protein
LITIFNEGQVGHPAQPKRDLSEVQNEACKEL